MQLAKNTDQIGSMRTSPTFPTTSRAAISGHKGGLHYEAYDYEKLPDTIMQALSLNLVSQGD